MEEWKEYKLGDVCEILDSKRKPLSSLQRQKRKGDFPYYGAQGIIDYVDGYLFDGTYLLVAEDGNNVLAQKEDIANIASGKFWVNNHAHVLAYNGKCDLLLLEYILNKKDISSYVTGTAQPKLNQANLIKIPIKLPSIDTQHNIINILKSFNDKIENNRRINENLEQQAQALFKSWFVDFEPFKDKPFVESELGKIPQGWKVVELGSVILSIKDKVGDRTDVKVLSPITTGELVLSEDFFSKQVYSKSIAKYILVRPNDFAYNPARVNIGSLGMNTYNFYGCVSPVYVVLRCEEGYEQFFNFLRKRDSFKKEVFSRAIGGVRQTLSYTDFSLIKTIYPPREIVECFNIILNKFNTIIIELKKQIEILSKLRDTLLPKLMSGEIKV